MRRGSEFERRKDFADAAVLFVGNHEPSVGAFTSCAQSMFLIAVMVCIDS